MRLRAPSYPLITVDPYFSVWSSSDRLTDTDTVHWTGKKIGISGIAEIDGKEYRFIGRTPEDIPAMKQTLADADSFSTYYEFTAAGAGLRLRFMSPVIPSDPALMSRPVSYLDIKKFSDDGGRHTVRLKLAVSEEVCTDTAGDAAIETSTLEPAAGIQSVRMGRKEQKILCRSGDNLRIEWGYFYLSGKGRAYSEKKEDGLTYACIEREAEADNLFTFAYDDIYSIEYFGEKLKSFWNREGRPVTDEIAEAHRDFAAVAARCARIDAELFVDAVKAGGEKYAEMLQLAYRQSVAAHKLVLDGDGKILFISKECFSNGCAATVDVSYPSVPLFLLYNPELVKGMMRPIFRYARSEAWPYSFAPHDCGQYPLVNGQVYGHNALEKQMPVEECGNMLIMTAAVSVAERSTSFAEENMDLLDKWVVFLTENGSDPANQLCTDDFAGHLAHNCNLSLKAIMGIAGYAIIKYMSGDRATGRKFMGLARRMAADWTDRASNGDGSFRLAFDRPGTFSMKYNIVWDKLFGTNVMSAAAVNSEVASYLPKQHPFGLDLDNRQPYTKSDWLIWTATLAPDRETFEKISDRLWDAYNYTQSRVPMTDWYWTYTGLHKSYFSRTSNMEISFRNRTVIGGLFMKLLEYRKTVDLRSKQIYIK